MAKTEMADVADTTENSDAPLIDLNDASIKKLVARAKKRGYITYEQLNEALPQDQMSSDQLEDVMSALNEMGINIVENDEAGEDGEDAEQPEDEVESVDASEESAPALDVKKKEVIDRTDDPVRMYLREMGAVELLSREGEIAIAKRIEAGRDTMILGLCESPITFNAIIDWSTALNEGTMQLREILDLDAMLSKDPAPESLSDDDEASGEISEKTAGPSFKEEEEPEEAPAEEEEDSMQERRTPRPSDDEEEDNTLSLA
ncbi:MAG: polymerase subunit sigma, partial [Sphingomonas bacterium]|uniref:RNA polymerase sigma factor region1.1 domain-containing protein n=1 Tax=Sphingomonas bacterium TaxID=1895847 RepID=UPI002625DD54